MPPVQPYDLLIAFAPCVTTDGIVRAYAKHCKKRYLILWDFFPRYHIELKVFPGNLWLARIAKWLEARAINRFNAVGLMSPANIAYFRHYHPNYHGDVEVLSLWGPATLVDRQERSAARVQFTLSEKHVACVFGGQLIAGRGIEHIFTLAASMRERLPHAVFVIAGSGPLEAMIRARLASGDFANVRFLGQLARPDYLRLLCAGDIGLVFNSGHVSVPTYPSKTIDYFRAALPILGVVEKASDYSHIITHEVQAGYSTDPENMAWLEQKLLDLATSAELRDACGNRGQQHFLAHMTAARIATQLESGVQ
jgi:glycosyltransferase involved in cell wall biosynthesis